MSESLSSLTSEPGRIASDATQANQAGWKRWLPGLNTLRAYESSWLRHDIVAGLVMTTMLVPVGIAYAGLAEFVHSVNSVQNRHAESLLAAGLSRNRLHRRFLPLAKLGHGTLP